MNLSLTSHEIITELKTIFDKQYDKDLAELLDVEKQSIYQYKQKEQIDIQQKMICLLIEKIKQSDETLK